MVDKKTIEQFFGRLKLYFTSGHSIVLYIPWFITQTTVTYYLVIQNAPVLEIYFSRFYIFFILFSTIYPAGAILLGYWYLKRTSLYASESSTSIRQNPYNTDLAKAVKCYAEGKNSEALEILKKWSTE